MMMGTTYQTMMSGAFEMLSPVEVAVAVAVTVAVAVAAVAD